MCTLNLSSCTSLALICTFLLVPGGEASCPYPGTTPGIKGLVLGRCLQYQTLGNPDQFCDNGETPEENCNKLANLFINAFAFQPTCNVTFERFDEFIKEAHYDVTPGQVMFWSDVYGIVQRYSQRGRRARPLEDTLIGYMADGLRFCAQTAEPGFINNSACAGFDETDECPLNAEFTFWALASRNYARTAQGAVKIMLNASLEEAYRNSSFFGSWELPNIDNSRVTAMTILLVHIPGQTIRTTCESDNIQLLKSRLQMKNITSECEDAPWGPQTMLCMDFPDEEECKRDSGVDDSSRLNFNAFCLLFGIYTYSLLH